MPFYYFARHLFLRTSVCTEQEEGEEDLSRFLFRILAARMALETAANMLMLSAAQGRGDAFGLGHGLSAAYHHHQSPPSSSFLPVNQALIPSSSTTRPRSMPSNVFSEYLNYSPIAPAGPAPTIRTELFDGSDMISDGSGDRLCPRHMEA